MATIIYAGQPLPTHRTPSIFLVGPTPRSKNVMSWRPAALQVLESLEFNGFVFVPENQNPDQTMVLDEDDLESLWLKQVEWEQEGLERAEIIAAWVPRSRDLPAFTTNVEFGRYVTSGRLRYGRPDGAPRTRYLDWLYQKDTGLTPHCTLEGLLNHAVRDAIY